MIIFFRTACPAIRTNCFVKLDRYVVLPDLPQGGAKHDILLVISVASVLYTKEQERIGMSVKYCRQDDDASLYVPTDSNPDNSTDLSMEEASKASLTGIIRMAARHKPCPSFKQYLPGDNHNV